MNFNELNLSKPLARAIAEFGYTTPSPIQQKAIPPVLAGRDLIGCAQTGTGKTAAFALPMLELLSKGQRAKAGVIRALILTPTRELALQIGQNFTDYGKHMGLRHTVIFGGVGQMPQVAAIKRGVDVLIACPGRLNDLSNQGYIDLSKLEIFVLDEADRMLDMGFVHDVKRVVAKLPKKRQNLMFSATMPKEIEALASTFLHEPVKVKVDPVSSTVEKIDQSLYFVEKGNKKHLLIHLIQTLNLTNALVFSRTKHGADKIVKDLGKAGITAAAIHGNKGQNARVLALENFKAGKTRVLVATDIAARGIDINELSHVFNFDLPEVPETYVHRIGRTARAGADGIAISFCASEEKEYLRGIEKLNRKTIPVVSEHPWAGKPSPVKPIIAPVRGRRPVQGEQSAPVKEPRTRGNAPVPARETIAKGATTRGASHNKGEAIMAEKDNTGQNAPRQNGQNRGRSQRQGGKFQQKPQNNQNRQNNHSAQAQQKFDPRFLTPQAAEQIPHAAPVPREEPQMVEARRYQGSNQNRNNQNRDNRGAQNRNNQNRDNRGAQNRERAPRQNGENAPRNAQNAPAAPRAGAQPPRQSGQRNAPRGAQPQNRDNRDNRGAQPAHRDNRDNRNAPQSRDSRDNRNPQPQSRDNRNANGRDNRNGNGRDNRSGYNTRGMGRSASAGLKSVRTQKPSVYGEKEKGIELISKKPPQQKFTSFDAYMSAHGGESTPIKEQND